MPDNNIAFPTESDEKGFADAVSLFAQDDAPQPPPTPKPAPAPVPEPETEPAPEQAAAEDAINNEETPKTEPEKLEEEFIEFTGKQKERFNSVYGALKRLERENADYQRRLQQYQQVPQQSQPQPAAPPVFQPPQFAEPKPLLANFETADQWADAVSDWSARKAETAAMSRLNADRIRQNEESNVRQYNDFINSKIADGQKKFGQREFNNAAKDIVEFAPHGSQMYNTLFDLERFPEVVVHLSKNLELADRISSLRPFDQVYELKALEKKLALAAKQPPKLPTKVEAPGNGEDQKQPLSVPKLRQAAKASGQIKDWAKVFQSDPTM